MNHFDGKLRILLKILNKILKIRNKLFKKFENKKG